MTAVYTSGHKYELPLEDFAASLDIMTEISAKNSILKTKGLILRVGWGNHFKDKNKPYFTYTDKTINYYEPKN